MNQLTYEQALQIIQQSINKALEKGVFVNLNDISLVMNAIQTLSQNKNQNVSIEQQ